MNCEICGARMNHYENPDSWKCPSEYKHAKIEAEDRAGDKKPHSERAPRTQSNQYIKKRKDGKR